MLLDIVTEQVTGNWRWWRKVFLSAIVLLMIIVALSPGAKDVISSLVDDKVPGIPPSSIKRLLPDILLFAFIAASEVWHFVPSA